MVAPPAMNAATTISKFVSIVVLVGSVVLVYLHSRRQIAEWHSCSWGDACWDATTMVSITGGCVPALRYGVSARW